MTMSRKLRKLTLTAHVLFSVGWLGAVVAYLVLAVTALRSEDVQLARSAYISMEMIGLYSIVPLSFAALSTGLIQSLGTEWGLFKHYWIVTKFILTFGGAIILVAHMRVVSHVAGFARDAAFSPTALGVMRVSVVVHALGGLLLLIVATVLSIYKPWGKTPVGRRKQVAAN